MSKGKKKGKGEPMEIYTAALVKLELITHLYRTGQIPFDDYWRVKRQLEPEARKELEEVRRWAVEEAKLVTAEEWENLRAHYRDEIGDSFVHLLNAARRNAVFITNNPKVLADRRKLEKRFGVKIMSGEKFQQKMGEAGKAAVDNLMRELLGRPRPA
ncbi:MAG: hypothetical protein BDTLLHRC_001590 [Candidatus Fervidibacter sp.]|jgi:hypothetical protein